MSDSSANSKTGELRFEAPGPGSWQLDTTHWTRPLTRLFASLYRDPFARGFTDSARRYGLLLLCPRLEFVHGFVYASVLPAPEHEIPERFATAARVFETKLWRDDMRRWDQEVKPAAIEAHRALQQVEPRGLDRPALVDHVEKCRAHLERMFEQHQKFIAPALIPTGDFLVQASKLSGLPPAQFLLLLRGSAPISAGAEDGLEGVAEAIHGDRGARDTLQSKATAADVLAELLRRPGAVGAALRSYLDMVECRPLDGFDLSYACGFELPDVLVRAISGAVEGRGQPARDEHAARLIKERVPDSERQRFDELLSEARHVYRLRDERSIYSDIWAIGLLRRAVLAAGTRLAADGRIEEPSHLIDADITELRLLLNDGSGPSAGELAARARFRASHSVKDAPPVLGDTPMAPPPLDGLPAPVARAMGAFGAHMHMIFADGDTTSDARFVRGLAASPGLYEGVARRITGPEELGRLLPGDVLVAVTTSEAFNVALPLVSAIVTDSGGILSHAAIVAREYGMPAVVGTRVATERIADGARVRVDGNAGTVELLT